LSQCPATTTLYRSIYVPLVKVKVNQSPSRPGYALAVPRGSGSRISRQLAYEGGKFVSPTHQPSLPPKKYSWYSLLLQAESTPWPHAAGRIMSMKNSDDIVENRTRDLSACSAVPQPTAPPPAPSNVLLLCYCYTTMLQLLDYNDSVVCAKGNWGTAPCIPNLNSTFDDYPHATVALSRGMGPPCSLGGSHRWSGCLEGEKNVLHLPGNEPWHLERPACCPVTVPTEISRLPIILLQQYITNIAISSISVTSATDCATWRIFFVYAFTFFVFLDSPNSNFSPSHILSVLFSCHFIPQFIHTIRISADTPSSKTTQQYYNF